MQSTLDSIEQTAHHPQTTEEEIRREEDNELSNSSGEPQQNEGERRTYNEERADDIRRDIVEATNDAAITTRT